MASTKHVLLGLVGVAALVAGGMAAPAAEASAVAARVQADGAELEGLGEDGGGWEGGVDEGGPAQAGRCGGPGKPPCPMQAFMRTSVAAPLAANHTEAVAAGLDRVAAYSPEPAWTSWRRFAQDGAKAARAGNLSAVRASCKGCHDAWRAAYRAKHRARPVGR